MIIRIQSRDGIERHPIDTRTVTVADLKTLIAAHLRAPVLSQTLSANHNLLLAKTPDQIAQFTDFSNIETLVSFSYGQTIHLCYEGECMITTPGPKITPAGSFGYKMTHG